MHNQTQTNQAQGAVITEKEAAILVAVNEFNTFTDVPDVLERLDCILFAALDSDLLDDNFYRSNLIYAYQRVKELLKAIDKCADKAVPNVDYYQKTIDAQKKRIEDLQGTIKTLSTNI